MTTIVVLGDVHGNARALRAALACARSGPMDHLVFLGDLLTYGHDVAETLDLVADAQARHDAVLLIGNHDQLYFDLDRGDRAYAARLPSWIQESVAHTTARLDLPALRTGLRWSHEHVFEDVLFAHANPFGVGDWTYLNHPPELERAAACLTERGMYAGVFGHTHRPRWGEAEVAAGSSIMSPRVGPIVGNAGSIGQPRDGRGQTVLLRLELTPATSTATYEAVEYDVGAHVAALTTSGLSTSTIERLVGFFARREPA